MAPELAALLLGGVAGGAVNLIFRLRNIEAFKAELKAANDAAQADRDGVIRRQVDTAIRSHESTVRLAADTELRIFDREMQRLADVQAALATLWFATRQLPIHVDKNEIFDTAAAKLERAYVCCFSAPSQYTRSLTDFVLRCESMFLDFMEVLRDTPRAAEAFEKAGKTMREELHPRYAAAMKTIDEWAASLEAQRTSILARLEHK